MIEPQETSFEDNDVPIESKSDNVVQLSIEEVVSLVESGIPQEVKILTSEELKEKQRELSKLPYLSSEVFSELVYVRGEDLGLIMVDTKDIVGSISSVFKDWSTEYDYRKGRNVAIAQQLINPTPESVDRIFHVSEPWFQSGIKLGQLSTPEGNMYFVFDGSHRVAGCKLAKLNRIPAFVETIPEANEISTNSFILKSQWEEKIKRGLIVGNVETPNNREDGNSFVLNIQSQILPWMYLSNNKIVELNKFYFEHFPNARNLNSLLNGKPIPKEVLTDDSLFTDYLTNGWDKDSTEY
jgi:hypothetical protein